MIHSKPFRAPLLAALLLGASACHSTPADTPDVDASTSGPSESASGATAGSIEKIDGQQAKQLVDDGAFLLDVRTPEEFSEGHVDGATNIPVQVLAERMTEVPEEAPIVVYCHSGRRSAQAAEMLKEKGYEVHDLGPMSAW